MRADLHFVINADICPKLSVGADFGIFTDKTIRADNGIITNLYAFLNNCIGSDRNIFT